MKATGKTEYQIPEESGVVTVWVPGYQVASGDTLSGIIENFYGQYDTMMLSGIQNFNEMGDSTIIDVGEWIALPTDVENLQAQDISVKCANVDVTTTFSKNLSTYFLAFGVLNDTCGLGEA